MAVVTSVPLNTMLADLDESLRAMLKRELARHGFDGVDIVFEAPTKEWAAALSAPTVNLFLYDLREATDRRISEWKEHRGNGQAFQERPPLRVEVSYAVTAWTRAVEDEHRLLSQVLAVLYAYPILPSDVLAGTLANGTQPFPLDTKTAQGRSEDKADFWTSIGGQYKASLDYIVFASCDAGTRYKRGPEVRTATIQLRDVDRPRASMEEFHRAGGVVTDADGEPVANAWVALPAGGLWAASDAKGRFRFAPLEPGTYDVVARTADGAEAKGKLEVPGQGAELSLGAKPKAPAKKRS
jgi:Pvc16 N-terminal domain/Carboxypeptidase regulatory-like domain